MAVLTHVAPVGLRFLDPALEAQVRDGLRPSLRPAAGAGAGAPVRAFRNGDGLHSFRWLPGLQAQEYPTGEPPAGTKPFVLEVRDGPGRFLPLVTTLDLPDPRGIVEFYLFSAPARAGGPGLGALRGRLWEKARDAPAAFAVITAEHGTKSWYGMTDARGCFALLIPYPVIPGRPAGAGPAGGLQTQLRWDLTIKVQYQGTPLPTVAGTGWPDVRQILRQPSAKLFPRATGSASSARRTLTATLIFGQDLILRSGDLSVLLIRPG